MAGRPRKVPPVPVPSGQKFCFKCMAAKPVAAFALDLATWDQRRTICRSCDDARYRAYYARKRWQEAKARLEGTLTDPAASVSIPPSTPKTTGEVRPVQ